jgi:hypothetical protein
MTIPADRPILHGGPPGAGLRAQRDPRADPAGGRGGRVEAYTGCDNRVTGADAADVNLCLTDDGQQALSQTTPGSGLAAAGNAPWSTSGQRAPPQRAG